MTPRHPINKPHLYRLLLCITFIIYHQPVIASSSSTSLLSLQHVDSTIGRNFNSKSTNSKFQSIKRRGQQLRKQDSLSPSLAFAAKYQARNPKPIDESKWEKGAFPAKEHCSKCGLCETTYVTKVKEACAFLEKGMSKIEDMEQDIHGRPRDLGSMVWPTFDPAISNHETIVDSRTYDLAEEGRFGVLNQPMKLAKGTVKGSQWTGCVTGIALAMLETNMVDAVVCISGKENEGEQGMSWSEPEPIIARTAEEVLRGRGVKPALAPSLKVLDEIVEDKSIRRLLFCGVGCAVQAFRSVQDDLNLDEVYVLGTNCADNSPTPKAAQSFLRDGLQVDETQVLGYEFMQDFRVHVKMKNKENSAISSNMNRNHDSDESVNYITKPYFCLPGKIAKSSIAKSCLACFDYTNALADVVVGYMGAPLDNKSMDCSSQTLTIRNSRGEMMVNTALDQGRLIVNQAAQGKGKHESIAIATVNADGIIAGMTGGEVKEEGMPKLMGEIVALLLGNKFVGVAPKGVAFARYSIDYHILRNYLYVLDEWGEERVDWNTHIGSSSCLPKYARDIVDRYRRENSTFEALRNVILCKKNLLAKHEQ